MSVKMTTVALGTKLYSLQPGTGTERIAEEWTLRAMWETDSKMYYLCSAKISGQTVETCRTFDENGFSYFGSGERQVIAGMSAAPKRRELFLENPALKKEELQPGLYNLYAVGEPVVGFDALYSQQTYDYRYVATKLGSVPPKEARYLVGTVRIMQ